MKKLALASIMLLATVSAPAFAADLLGSTATVTLLYPDQGTVYAGPASATVGNSVEFPQGTIAPGPFSFGSFDIAANTITFFTNFSGNYGSGAFNGYRIDFTNAPIALTSLALDASSSFTPAGYSLVGNSVFFDVAGLTANGGSTVFNVGVAAVPEPATWAMMIAGFGMVGGALRRRRSGTASAAYA